MPHDKVAYEKPPDGDVRFADDAGKPLTATETCWGAVEDVRRVEIIRCTLGELIRRSIGRLINLPDRTLFAGAHRPEFGPLSAPGNLASIEADGTLRSGHDAFNEI